MKPEALRARIDFPGGQIKPRERSAGPSADSGRATRARPFRPAPPVVGRPGDGPGFHPSPGIRGLPSPAPSHPPRPPQLLRFGSCAYSLARAARGEPTGSAQLRPAGRVLADAAAAAAAAEAAAAPPPQARPNRRGDDASRSAGPKRRARRRPGQAARGLLATPTARGRRGPVPPRAGPRRHPSGRAAFGCR